MANQKAVRINAHQNWTAQNAEAFAHKVAFDFIAQVERLLHARGVSRAQLARQLGVTQGSVSQVLNGPQNLTLKTVGRYCNALGIKAAVVAYDDGDHSNEMGLVNSAVFAECWNKLGCPRDTWQLEELDQTRATTTGYMWCNVSMVSHTTTYSVTAGFAFTSGWYPGSAAHSPISSTARLSNPELSYAESQHA